MLFSDFKFSALITGLTAVILTACAHTTTETVPVASSMSVVTPSVMPKYKSVVSEIAKNDSIIAAFNTIEADRQRNIDLLIELTEIPAPPFGEQKRGEHFADLLRTAGLSDVTIDEVGNVIGRRHGIKGNRTVALAAHLDTVFPIETDVTVKKNGDTYTAPGIGDNTRGLVLILSLLRALEVHNIQTEADLLFIGNVGEEGLGDLRGVKHLYRKDGPKIDSLLAIDGGATNRLIYGGVGSHRYRVKVKGPGGHSWSAFGGANPHHALARAAAFFAERALEITLQGPKTSFNVGRIGGGTSINSIPFESWMEVDMRSGDQGKLNDIDAVFKQAVQDGLEAENEARISGPELTADVKKIGVRPAGRSDPNSPLVQHAIAAMSTLNITPELSISSTDANIPISRGLPAITMSRGGEGKYAHSLNENWTDADAHKAIQIALLVTLAQAGHSNP